ncbi:MAG: histidine phosphatase family protein [Caldilineaceae bacterium]
MITKIYLARHATPDWSRTDIPYDVPPGPPLTAQGEVEASQLGSFFKKAGITRIYTSPLERTLRTAQIAGAAVGVTPIVEEAIAEWRRGESETEIVSRFTALWERFCEESQAGGPIALVTHGGPIKAMLLTLGMARAEVDQLCRTYDRGNPLPPAGVWLAANSTGEAPWRLELVFTPQKVTAPAPASQPLVGAETVYV